jgi:hypothetical protein
MGGGWGDFDKKSFGGAICKRHTPEPRQNSACSAMFVKDESLF